MAEPSYIDYIQDKIKGQNVLDIGCCATKEVNILKRHLLWKAVCKEIIGVDINFNYLMKAVKEHPETKNTLYELDICNRQAVDVFQSIHGKFDHIICTDVIEHISNPGIMLENLWHLCSINGTIYFTTPNAHCLIHFHAMMEKGNCDIARDHVCWYDIQTLTILLNQHGFKVKEYKYFNHRISRKLEQRYGLAGMYKEWMGKQLYVEVVKGR